jgi:lipopolysaccharide export system protein LptA
MRALWLMAILLAAAAPAGAQEAQGGGAPGGLGGFGDFEHDASLPVEITADALAVDQAAGTAVYTGSVLVGQGALRLAADRLEVVYGEDATGATAIQRMRADGNVTLASGAEAAEAAAATYVVATGVVEMEGDVLLTQGANALAGQKLVIDLTAGTARMEGRVQTIFTPEQKPAGQ